MAAQVQPGWLRSQLKLLVAIDVLAAAGATLLSQILALGNSTAVLMIRGVEVPYAAAVVLTVPTWLALLAIAGCYDLGPFGRPAAETRQIISAGAHFLAVVAVAYYIVHLEQLGRGFAIAVVPLAAGFTLIGRAGARWVLYQRVTKGLAIRRAIVVGPQHNADELRMCIDDHPGCGISIVGVVQLNGRATDDVVDAIEQQDVDLLVITGATEPGTLRRLTWQLEGTGVGCMVAPAASQLVGPQFEVRPVAGLPLLYVDRRASRTPTTV